EIELDGNAVHDPRRAAGVVRAVAEPAAGGAERRGTNALDREGETVGRRVAAGGDLERELRRECADGLGRIVEGAAGFGAAAVGELQVAAGDRRAAVERQAGRAGEATAEVDAADRRRGHCRDLSGFRAFARRVRRAGPGAARIRIDRAD